MVAGKFLSAARTPSRNTSEVNVQAKGGGGGGGRATVVVYNMRVLSKQILIFPSLMKILFLPAIRYPLAEHLFCGTLWLGAAD